MPKQSQHMTLIGICCAALLLPRRSNDRAPEWMASRPASSSQDIKKLLPDCALRQFTASLSLFVRSEFCTSCSSSLSALDKVQNVASGNGPRQRRIHKKTIGNMRISQKVVAADINLVPSPSTLVLIKLRQKASSFRRIDVLSSNYQQRLDRISTSWCYRMMMEQ